MDEPKVISEAVSFEADSLRLAGRLDYREDTSGERGVLLLSPHPHFAGDLNNNVVRALALEFARRGLLVLRFDYHGIGDSQAKDLPHSIFDHWREIEEGSLYELPLRDARSARAYLGSLLGAGARPALVGYSFGGLLALVLREELEAAERVIAIAPPTARLPEPRNERGGRALLIQGEEDFVFDRTSLDALRRRLGERLEARLLASEDHFFRGREAWLAGFVADCLSSAD